MCSLWLIDWKNLIIGTNCWSVKLDVRFVSALAIVNLTLALWEFLYQKCVHTQLSVWGSNLPETKLRVDTLRLLYVTEGSGCLNWLTGSLVNTHDAAAVSWSMLEFVWMLALFILGMPACLFIAVFTETYASGATILLLLSSSFSLLSANAFWFDVTGHLPRVCSVASNVPDIKAENISYGEAISTLWCIIFCKHLTAPKPIVSVAKKIWSNLILNIIPSVMGKVKKHSLDTNSNNDEVSIIMMDTCIQLFSLWETCVCVCTYIYILVCSLCFPMCLKDRDSTSVWACVCMYVCTSSCIFKERM